MVGLGIITVVIIVVIIVVAIAVMIVITKTHLCLCTCHNPTVLCFVLERVTARVNTIKNSDFFNQQCSMNIVHERCLEIQIRV